MLNSYTNPTSLVIAGAWNPDVLSPKWIGKEVLGMQLGQDFPVTVQLPIGSPTQRPTYEFENIKYVVSRASLTFFLNPDDATQFEKSIRSAATILNLLAHTPVTGFGFNFFLKLKNLQQLCLEHFRQGHCSLI